MGPNSTAATRTKATSSPISLPTEAARCRRMLHVGRSQPRCCRGEPACDSDHWRAMGIWRRGRVREAGAAALCARPAEVPCGFRGAIARPRAVGRGRFMTARGESPPPNRFPAARRRRAPRAEIRHSTLSAHGSDLGGRLRLDEGGELARRAARSEPVAGDIRAHLEAENAYADALLAPTLPLQRRARARNARASQGGRQRAAAGRTGLWPITRAFATGGQHRIYCRTPRGGQRDGADRRRRAG